MSLWLKVVLVAALILWVHGQMRMILVYRGRAVSRVVGPIDPDSTGSLQFAAATQIISCIALIPVVLLWTGRGNVTWIAAIAVALSVAYLVPAVMTGCPTWPTRHDLTPKGMRWMWTQRLTGLAWRAVVLALCI